MPIYEYRCNACGYETEIFQSMNAKNIKKCPNCLQKKFEKLISGGCHAFVTAVTTLGQLAERNSKSMGDELVAKKMDEYGIKPNTLDDVDRRLRSASKEEITKYIEDGKIPPKKSQLTKKEVIEKQKEERKASKDVERVVKLKRDKGK